MKNVLILLGLFVAVPGHCAVDSADAPIRAVGIPEAISISTSAYTLAVSTTARAVPGLNGIIVDNPSTNTGAMHGHIGNCTSTAVSISSVKGPIELVAASAPLFLNIEDGKCLWLVSRHSGAESVNVQGFSQR